MSASIADLKMYAADPVPLCEKCGACFGCGRMGLPHENHCAEPHKCPHGVQCGDVNDGAICPRCDDMREWGVLLCGCARGGTP